ncbi:MAG: tetratricopeptide repeat protein [Alphaproteobacteria bacterium]
MTFHDGGDRRRRSPLTPQEINTTARRIANIVGDPARSEFSDDEFNAWSERQVDRTTDINGNIVSTNIEPFKPKVTRQDLNLDGSVGDKANNARREVFAVKKVLSRAGVFDFMPGLEPTTAPNERFTKAIKLLLPMSNAGVAKAQHLLGATYNFADGRTGVKRNKTKARFWYEKAVKQDYTPALRDLGFSLVGPPKSTKRGMHLLKMAAERGDAQAQWGMGFYLMNSNRGVPADRPAARKWLLRAIEQKYAYAATHLLLMYRRDGDNVEAYKWDIVGKYLWEQQGAATKGPLIRPDVRRRMTKSQIAEAQRRAVAWLAAHRDKPI